MRIYKLIMKGNDFMAIMANVMGHEVDLSPAFDKMKARLARLREANKKALANIQSQIEAFDATPDELLEEDASLFMMPDQDADDMTVVSGDGIKRGKNVPEDTPSVFQQPYSEQPQNAYNSRQNDYTTQGFQCQVQFGNNTNFGSYNYYQPQSYYGYNNMVNAAPGYNTGYGGYQQQGNYYYQPQQKVYGGDEALKRLFPRRNQQQPYYGYNNYNYGNFYQQPYYDYQQTPPSISSIPPEMFIRVPNMFDNLDPIRFYNININQFCSREELYDYIKKLEEKRKQHLDAQVYIMKLRYCRGLDGEEYEEACRQIEKQYGFVSLADLAKQRKEYEEAEKKRNYEEAKANGEIDLLHSEEDYTGYDLNGIRRERTTLKFKLYDEETGELIGESSPADPETGYRILKYSFQDDMKQRQVSENWNKVLQDSERRRYQIQAAFAKLHDDAEKFYGKCKTADEKLQAWYNRVVVEPGRKAYQAWKMNRLWDKNKWKDSLKRNGINNDIKFSNTSTAFFSNYNLKAQLAKAQQLYTVEELDNNKQLTSILQKDYDIRRQKFLGNIMKGDCTSNVSLMQDNGTEVKYHTPIDSIKVGENEIISWDNPEAFLPGGEDIPLPVVTKRTVTHGVLSDEELREVINRPGGVITEEVVKEFEESVPF